MCNMLAKVGWKKDFIAKALPVLPISGWLGDLLTKLVWDSGTRVALPISARGRPTM